MRLVERPADGTQRGRIDRVFRALAAARGGRGVGVVLTGAGSDGALGLARVKDRGGLTIVQDPVEAEFGGMPRSALEAGVVDLVLPLREIPTAIARYCGAAPKLPSKRHESAKRDTAPLADLLDLLEQRTGLDFSVYQRSLVMRRADKRMRVHAINDWAGYLELLRADTGEAEALANDLLLNVSEFFGQKTAFGRLETDVLPRLFAMKSGAHDTLRAWVVGCSTGEQAYSLGIALLEHRAACEVQPSIQIFASDMAEASLQRARLGFYPAEIEGFVSPERLAGFFTRDDERGYRVRTELRRLVVFASHDVVKDFPFSQLDLVVCRRSLLDVLKRDVRRAVLRSFHYALRPHGLLVVDSSVGLDLEAPQLFALRRRRRRLPAARNDPTIALAVSGAVRGACRCG